MEQIVGLGVQPGMVARARTLSGPALARLLGAALVVAALAAPVPTRAASGARRTVELVVLGDFPEALLDAIGAGLRDELQVEVLPVRRERLPSSAYYAPRRRYRAEKLLDHMLQSSTGPVSRLGLTRVDISTTKGRHRDWGVFGLAYLSERAAVISTHRLRRQVRDEAHFRFRVVSTAVHEVGHMLGLDHCVEPRCVMNDAHGSIATVDRSTGKLGPRCRQRLERSVPLP